MHTQNRAPLQIHMLHTRTHAYAQTLMHVRRALTYVHSPTAVSTGVHPFTHTRCTLMHTLTHIHLLIPTHSGTLSHTHTFKLTVSHLHAPSGHSHAWTPTHTCPRKHAHMHKCRRQSRTLPRGGPAAWGSLEVSSPAEDASRAQAPVGLGPGWAGACWCPAQVAVAGRPCAAAPPVITMRQQLSRRADGASN